MKYHHYNPQNTPPPQNRTQAQAVPTQQPKPRPKQPENPQKQPSKPVQNTPPHQLGQGGQSRQMPQSNSTRQAQTKPQPRKAVPVKKPLKAPATARTKRSDTKAKKKLPLGNGIAGLLHGLIPSSVYDPGSKKIFGIFSAEDLLLVALIFLCAESDDEDNSVMILALLYILVSDYIELPDLSF